MLETRDRAHGRRRELHRHAVVERRRHNWRKRDRTKVGHRDPPSMDGYAWAQQVLSVFFISRSEARLRWSAASTCSAPLLGPRCNGPWQHRSAPLIQEPAEPG